MVSACLAGILVCTCIQHCFSEEEDKTTATEKTDTEDDQDDDDTVDNKDDDDTVDGDGKDDDDKDDDDKDDDDTVDGDGKDEDEEGEDNNDNDDNRDNNDNDQDNETDDDGNGNGNQNGYGNSNIEEEEPFDEVYFSDDTLARITKNPLSGANWVITDWSLKSRAKVVNHGSGTPVNKTRLCFFETQQAGTFALFLQTVHEPEEPVQLPETDEVVVSCEFKLINDFEWVSHKEIFQKKEDKKKHFRPSLVFLSSAVRLSLVALPQWRRIQLWWSGRVWLSWGAYAEIYRTVSASQRYLLTLTLRNLC